MSMPQYSMNLPHNQTSTQYHNKMTVPYDEKTFKELKAI